MNVNYTSLMPEGRVLKNNLLQNVRVNQTSVSEHRLSAINIIWSQDSTVLKA
jgi:hypothetical protein